MFANRKIYAIALICICVGIMLFSIFLYYKKGSDSSHENTFADIPKNIEVGDYGGDISDQVIYERSLFKKNLQDCTGIKNYQLQEECQLKIATYKAIKEEKIEICSDLQNEDTKDSCIGNVARELAKKKSQPEICQKITDISQKFECIEAVGSNEKEDQGNQENATSGIDYTNRAIEQRKLQLCIQDNHYDESCIMDAIKNILEKDGNAKWCESLVETDPQNYLRCRDVGLQMNKSNRMHNLIKQTIIDGNDDACANDLSLQDQCISAYKKISKILISY